AAAKPAAKVAQLAIAVSGVPSTIRRSRWMTLKVRVANTGTAAAQAVRLRVGAARGLSVRPRTLTLKTLKAGKSTTRRIKVALTPKARQTTTVRFTAAGAKKLQARGRVALTIGKAKQKAKPAPGTTPSTPKSPLAGTYWWYNINHVDWAWDNHGVYFIDDRWAYRGIPTGGLPGSCTAVTAGIDDKGNETDGCITYTYDAATGAVTLGAAAGTFKNGELRIFDEGDERFYERLIVPAAGARYDVDLLHRSFSGMCGLFAGCTTGLKTLKLSGDGQFILSSSVVGTFGDAGTGPFTAVASYPPDQHGTYEVGAGGRIHLVYADGTAKDHTFAIQTVDAGGPNAGQPDPVNEGVMLDDDNYYRETD
ncbi:MAG TPA: CARDB domain-containing protein, partial [Baekduia sp.]|nr:CARDB domain-containing protein [Baekduia sp.]